MLDTEQQTHVNEQDDHAPRGSEQTQEPEKSGKPKQPQQRERIAVLGGGCGAMAAVFAITESPHWKQKYDITVYQSGWRLGGKGASGRNAEHGQRIEEHGLHVWSGFYENAFWLMRRCYAALDLPRTHPLSSAFTAFRPRHYVSLGQQDKDSSTKDWHFWSGYLPHDAGRPGDAVTCERCNRYKPVSRVRTPWEYMAEMIPWAFRYLQTTSVGTGEALRKEVDRRDRLLDALLCGGPKDKPWPQRAWANIKNAFIVIWLFFVFLAFRRANRYHDRAMRWKSQAGQQGVLHRWFRSRPFNGKAGCFKRLARGLVLLRWWSGRELTRVKALVEARRAMNASRRTEEKDQELEQLEGTFTFFVVTNLALAMMIGMIRDGVLERGFSAIDEHDLRAWLNHHGAQPAGVNSATVMSAYSYVFAFKHGDYKYPNLAAGVALRLMFRLLLASRGAVFWEMSAGMGDTVFAPLYKELKKRGVKFRFFHRVRSLETSDGLDIDTIRIGRQATLTAVAKAQDDEYRPLVTVKGVPCWPSHPLYDQLVDGEEMRGFFNSAPCDLESAYTGWPDCELVLKKGTDFDRIILGISVGALPFVCKDLLKSYPDRPLAKAADKLGTTRTVGVQLWLSQSMEELGWIEPPPIITSYAGPLDTWADMSGLLEREDWQRADFPRSLAYFCGVIRDDEDERPRLLDPCQHPKRPAQAYSRLRADAINWLDDNAAVLWPRSIPKDTVMVGQPQVQRLEPEPNQPVPAQRPRVERADTRGKVNLTAETIGEQKQNRPLQDAEEPRIEGEGVETGRLPVTPEETVRKKRRWNARLLFRPQPRREAARALGPASDDDFYNCQWFVVNVDPSSRYVLSLPETTVCRPSADHSGFNNLILAGDWLRTGLNYGCVESAVVGGLQASRAICGFPPYIYGEHDLPPDYPLDRRRCKDAAKAEEAGFQRVVHDARKRKAAASIVP